MDQWVADFSTRFHRDFWVNQLDGNKTYIDPTPSESEMKGWLQHHSNSYNRPYYHNIYTNEVRWMPLSEDKAKVAIIVPFRDLHEEQRRSAHLKQFVAYMTKYMSSLFIPFKIFIMEQSDDGRKFNRGKLLNLGYHISASEGYDTFILHDVDLLPSMNLMQHYRSRPDANPVHIAKVWNRYNNNPDYFGGIVVFDKRQYESINGYPNNYWGWGGEDDEMMLRVKEVSFSDHVVVRSRL